MDAFSKEMLRVGTLRGFVYFSCYLRGREELLITISKRQPAEHDDTGVANQQVPLQGAMSPAKPINSDPAGKPPASPAARDALTANSSDTECVFLLGAYQRYKSPFVWLRGGMLDQYSGEDRDVPLKLQTTSDWVKHKAHVWDVIAELVALTVRPRPENPFAVDFGLLETIPLVQSTLSSGALLNTLHDILAEGVSVLDGTLIEDMQRLTEMHFMGLRALAEDVAEQEVLFAAAASACFCLPLPRGCCARRPAAPHSKSLCACRGIDAAGRRSRCWTGCRAEQVTAGWQEEEEEERRRAGVAQGAGQAP